MAATPGSTAAATVMIAAPGLTAAAEAESFFWAAVSLSNLG